jgi:hypothetical protein
MKGGVSVEGGGPNKAWEEGDFVDNRSTGMVANLVSEI